MEILLAFSLFTLFAISTFSLESSMAKLKIWSLKELDIMSATQFTDPSASDYMEEWGRNSCGSRFDFDPNRYSYFNQGINIGSGNISTDIEVRNGMVYLTADSTISSDPDLFIIDAGTVLNPALISSLNTGPGVSALEIAGPYIFMAQASSVRQLQIVDIHNRASPQLISQLKLSLPTPTTTAPFARSIFYLKGFIYLGTEKWNGAEFAIIDVSNIYDPMVVGVFETGTLVNDIYVKGNRAYLATADALQLRVLDISNKSNPVLIASFSPPGWQKQEGKVLDFFEGRLGLGRTVGGFNVLTNYEAFVFSTSTVDNANFIVGGFFSKDIPSGVYGILIREYNIYVISHSGGHEFQVWDSAFATKVAEIPLGINAEKMACDSRDFYFATGNARGFSVLKSND